MIMNFSLLNYIETISPRPILLALGLFRKLGISQREHPRRRLARQALPGRRRCCTYAAGAALFGQAV